jgi:lipopolysaccharide/colanic/teichoic acid biosynthesis glycosyltransferase
MYRNGVKRALDILLSLVVLTIGAVPMLIVALLIRLESPGPAIFRQERIGKDGRVFEFLKFRSMCLGAEHTGTGVYSDRNDTRVTRLGKILRATSIDELPQLINILKGDMSLIGPRPPLTYHPWPYEEYTEEQKRMFAVRPGITGWAQVHGRKGVEWHHRIELNVWYVDHVSFWLDVKIFFMTIYKVLCNADNENLEKTVK